MERHTPQRPLSFSNVASGFRPWRRAVTSNITGAQYTRRPQNSTEGGSTRRRHPGRPQHRLKRNSNASDKSGGPPRGLRRKGAWCSGPPQKGTPGPGSARLNPGRFGTEGKITIYSGGSQLVSSLLPYVGVVAGDPVYEPAKEREGAPSLLPRRSCLFLSIFPSFSEAVLK